jgi:hypothetical protein
MSPSIQMITKLLRSSQGAYLSSFLRAKPHLTVSVNRLKSLFVERIKPEQLELLVTNVAVNSLSLPYDSESVRILVKAVMEDRRPIRRSLTRLTFSEDDLFSLDLEEAVAVFSPVCQTAPFLSLQ